LLGFVQIGIAALTSTCVFLFNARTIMPVIVIFAATAWIALGIFTLGRKKLSPQPHLAAGETPVVPH
jgi:hypothetical protein